MGSHLMFVHKNIAKLKHHNERQADKQELFMIFPSGAVRGIKNVS